MVRVCLAFVVALIVNPLPAAAQSSVFLEELTWTEVWDAVRGGKTTIIVPTGGTEQNGPHMVLGKHNIIVKFTAGQQQGETAERIGTHAGIPDTSQLLALHPDGVRRAKLAVGRADDGSGVIGDPARATAAYGRQLLEFKIAAAVRDIRGWRESSRNVRVEPHR